MSKSIAWLRLWEKWWSDEGWICGSVPKKKKQISNFKFQDICDPLFVMIERSKWKKSQVNPFIPSFQSAPDAMCILVTDQQLNKMVCFCTNVKKF